MVTRRCFHCNEEKSIRGVWYLLAKPATIVNASRFVCESCYRQDTPAPAPRGMDALASELPAGPGAALSGFRTF